MTFDLFVALAVFAAIAAYTPGPNNTLLMACGVNYGFRVSVPMIAGVGIGFPFQIFCIGFGLGKVFEIYPVLLSVLKFAGAAYMLWLAWKIATSTPSSDESSKTAKPLTFLQGCAFQWVNPKAWIMGITAISTYTLAVHFYAGLAVVVAVFVIMGFTSAATWALFGVALKNVMNDPRYFRMINLGLAGLLVISLVPMLWH